jgi:hypothetical protein
MAGALVRWLCVTGFHRVCPSIFFFIGQGLYRLQKNSTEAKPYILLSKKGQCFYLGYLLSNYKGAQQQAAEAIAHGDLT